MTCPSCGASNDDQAVACFTCKAPLVSIGLGDVLGHRWEIRAFLGRGGMGAVYRALDRTLRDEVALKVIRPDLMGTPETRERFTSEIRLARRVSHPGVCRIHEYGEDGPRRFFTMELVEGRNLRDLIREEGPLPPERAGAIAAEMADALQAIHAAGIVHRDLKPLNVMVDHEGRVRLMDFGIAKGLASEGQGTGAGYVIGSPEYMSPEQARGRPVDSRSDLYSLGIVLFEMLTGRVPFRGDDPVTTLLMHVEDEPPLEQFPEPLRGVLERALAKDPEKRFRTASGVAQALRRALPTAPAETSTRPLPAVRDSARWAVPAGLAVLAVLGAFWIGRLRSEPEPIASTPPPSVAPTPTESAPPASAPPAIAATSMPPSTFVRAASPAPSPAAAATTLPEPIATASPTAEPTAEPTAVPTAEPTVVAEAVPTEVPRPPEPTAPPPTVPAKGRLSISVTPWARVSIDGVHVGETPFSEAIAAGEHRIVLTHDHYQPVLRVVRVKGGETERLSVDLAQEGVRR
jgi:eukaryotic-like serine/threonine-protein kinase